MRNGILALLIATLASYSMACDEHGLSGIVEDNDLHIPVGMKTLGGISQEEFNTVIDKISEVYAPIFTEKGAKLIVDRNWTDGTVNAYARQVGKNWHVAMFGGLARHEAITADGFATVVCHEIGHHIGGAPKKRSFWSSSWASNEGQADYFATSKCLRKYMEKDDNISLMTNVVVPQEVQTNCSNIFTSASEVAMCQRGAMAGLSLANLFKALRNLEHDLKFDTPDTKVVTRTDDNHPAPQCRLDTYFAGAICSQLDSDDVDQRDEAVSVCYRDNGDSTGVRPLCWFAPKK